MFKRALQVSWLWGFLNCFWDTSVTNYILSSQKPNSVWLKVCATFCWVPKNHDKYIFLQREARIVNYFDVWQTKERYSLYKPCYWKVKTRQLLSYTVKLVMHSREQEWRSGESTRLPPNYVTRVWLPDSASYVGWVCCWFSSLLREVFLWGLRFSPLLKNQHFQIPTDICNAHVNIFTWNMRNRNWFISFWVSLGRKACWICGSLFTCFVDMWTLRGLHKDTIRILFCFKH